MDSFIAKDRKYLGLDGEDPVWAHAKGEQIAIGNPPENTTTLIWAALDRSQGAPAWILVWRSDPLKEADGHTKFQLAVSRMPLRGGGVVELGRGTFDAPEGFNKASNELAPAGERSSLLPGPLLPAFQITSMAAGPDGVFLADYNRGILAVRGGKIMAFTEKEGLATRRLCCLAYCQGKSLRRHAGRLE